MTSAGSATPAPLAGAAPSAGDAPIRQTLDLDPNDAQAHYRLGVVQIQQRRYPAVTASLKRAVDLGAFYPQFTAALAFAHVVSGTRRAASGIVKDLERRSVWQLVPPVVIAEAYAGLGDANREIERLNRGIDQKDVYIPENFFEPLLDPLRKDPRFEPVLVRMALKRPVSIR